MRQTQHRRGRSIWSAPILALWVGVAVTGCDSLIDVSNPNSVTGDDAISPVAATNLVNGALFTLQDGYDYLLQSYSTASDELTWIGSRDAFQELDFGTLSNSANEFTDTGFILFAQGFWMTRETIRVLEEHNAAGDLADEIDLARAYLYGAIMQTSAANWLDDMVVASDRREAAPPIGPDNMGQLYTQALDWIAAGLAIAEGGSTLERDLLAVRARTEHSQAVWNMIGTRPISVSNQGLVNAGAASAQAALDAVATDGDDWEFTLVFSSSTQQSIIANSVNNRLELAFGRDYVTPIAAGTIRDVEAPDRGIVLDDPVTGNADMRLDVLFTAFEDAGNFPVLRVATAREMYLILAEAALANNDLATFATHINTVRGSMPDWVDGGGVAARDMLIHERRVNMFLMGQRLNDLYRFGQQSSNWQASSEAVNSPGVFLPITKTELDANCHTNPNFEC
jgi:hypothetical protein